MPALITTSPTTQSFLPTVLVSGPVPHSIGGMGQVHAQMMAFGASAGFRLVPFSPTVSPNVREGFFAKVRRHLDHLSRWRQAVIRHSARIAHLHTCSGFSFYRSCLDMLAARRLGCRTVLHIHGAKFEEFVAQASWWRRRIIARLLSAADVVIALSDGWRDSLSHIAPRANILVVENAVELPPERVPEIRPGACRFVLLARMDEWKGIDDLLHACSILQRQGLWFSVKLAGPPGTAGDAATLADKIASRRLQDVVRYVGPVRGRRKTELLESADVYVQPSHHEGMPIAVLEALAYGLPVVATAVGALPEIIEPGRQGLLSPPRDAEALAASMAKVAGDASLRMKMSQEAHRLAERRFNLTRFRTDLLNLYAGLVKPGAESATRPMAKPRTEVGHPVFEAGISLGNATPSHI